MSEQCGCGCAGTGRAGRRRRVLLALAGVAALAVSGAAVGYAAIPDGGGVIHACYQPNATNAGAGVPLLVIDTAKAQCPSGYTPITWNKTGPQGPQGVAGPRGLQGIQGIQGIQGVQGPAGPVHGYSNEGVAAVNLAASPSSTTVDTFVLPPGPALITDVVSLHTSAAPGDIGCSIYSGSSYIESADIGLDANSFGSLTINGGLTVAADGHVYLDCFLERGAAGGFYSYDSVTAMPVTALN